MDTTATNDQLELDNILNHIYFVAGLIQGGPAGN